MLQTRCLSTPVYGRSHFKKFWLRKLEKEGDTEALDMSSLSFVSQVHPHQQIMSTSLNSCDDLKLNDQKPHMCSSSIPFTGNTRPRVANAGKFGSVPLAHITPSPSDHESENDFQKDCSTVSSDYTLSLGSDKQTGGKPPSHRLPRSGSPILVTSGLGQSFNAFLQSPGFGSPHGGSHLGASGVGDGDDLGKQDLETNFRTIFDCKSVNLLHSIHDQEHEQPQEHDQPQETWKDSLSTTVDVANVVQVRENAQLCRTLESPKTSLRTLVMSTSNQERDDLSASVPPSFQSATADTELQYKVKSVLGTGGCTRKNFEHRLSFPLLDAAGLWRISGINPRESREQKQDDSKRLLCSESWNASSPSKESDYDKDKKTSGCRSKTDLSSQHFNSMNECSNSFPSPINPRQQLQLPEGGLTRNLARTCSHCGTMKTPLWRSGPSGPKSLCNACGIRLKKAGRTIVTKDSTENLISPPASSESAKLSNRATKRKLDKPNSFCTVDSRFARARPKLTQNHSPKFHLSKKTKIFPVKFRNVQPGEVYREKAGTTNREAHFSSPSTSSGRTSSACTHEILENYGVTQAGSSKALKHSLTILDLGLPTTNSTSLRRSFAKDEEEGAVLLMALSYGLVNA